MQGVKGIFPVCLFFQLSALAKPSSDLGLYLCCNSRSGCQVYWHAVALQEQVTELFGTCTKIQRWILGVFCIWVGWVATKVAWPLRNEF